METCPKCGFSPAVEATRMITTVMNRYQNQTDKSIVIVNSREYTIKTEKGDTLLQIDADSNVVKEPAKPTPKANITSIPATREIPAEPVKVVKPVAATNDKPQQT